MSFDSSHFIAAAAVVSTLLAKRPQEEHVEELRFAQATLAFIQTRLVEASAENIRAADARATAAEELARTADARATIAQAVAQEARIASARDDERARAAEARATAAEELARAADARASASDSTLLELRTAQAVGDRSFTSPPMPSIPEAAQISQLVASAVRSQLSAVSPHHSGSITHTEFYNSCPPRPLRDDLFWMRSRLSSERYLKIPRSPNFNPLRAEPELQELFDELMKVKKIGQDRVTCTYYNTTSNPFLSGRKPDGTFVVQGWRPSAAAVVMVAEVKVAKDFSRSDQGQLMTFLARVLDAQPDRAFIFGFLTNMIDIMFMRAVRVQGRDSFEVFGPMEQTSTLSKQCLGALMTASLADLGYHPPSLEGIADWDLQPFDVLGVGSSATVYHVNATAKSRSSPVGVLQCAVKLVRSNMAPVAEAQSSSAPAASAAGTSPLHAEVNVLRFVSSLGFSPACALTPTVVFACDSFFGMKPVGRHFFVDPAAGSSAASSSSASANATTGAKIVTRLPHRRHLFELIHLLMHLHQNGVYHRDIRPSNLFLIDEANVRDARPVAVAAISSMPAATLASKAESAAVPIASSSSSSSVSHASMSASSSSFAGGAAASSASCAARSPGGVRLMVADFGASIMRQVPAFRVASSKESILKSKPNPKSQSQASADVGPFATQPLPYSGAFTQASVSVLRHLAGLPATSASATTASAIAPARAIIRDESSGDVSVEVNPASARLSSAPYAFTAADELESVVHTVFTLIHPKLIGDALADWEQRCPRSRAHATALAAFWQHSMRAGAWREAVDAAHRVDYAAVAAALCRVLPGDIFWSGDDGGASTSRAEWGGESEDAWAAAEIAAIGRDQRSLFPGLFQ